VHLAILLDCSGPVLSAGKTVCHAKSCRLRQDNPPPANKPLFLFCFFLQAGRITANAAFHPRNSTAVPATPARCRLMWVSAAARAKSWSGKGGNPIRI